MQLSGYGHPGIIFLSTLVINKKSTVLNILPLKLKMIMKKYFLAMVAVMASMSLFAQVDSTNLAVDTTSTAGDSTYQSTVPSDTTGSGSSTDSTSMQSDTTSVGSTGGSEVTDEDLRKYAIVMDSVESMKDELLSEISTKIKSNGKMKIARYNQLSKAVDDQAKLQELKATPEEIAFVQEVATMKQEGAKKISDNVESLATNFVGTEKYNKIKGSLELDTNLRTRYDKVVSEMESDDSASAKTSN
jgi:hypothetical protein